MGTSAGTSTTPTTIQFRPLHENEAHLLSKMVESGEAGKWVIAASLADSEFEILIAYRYQEHREHEKYTIALVMIKGDEGAMMLTGVSKHNKADPPNPILGRVKALRRAFASEVVFDLGPAISEPDITFPEIALSGRPAPRPQP